MNLLSDYFTNSVWTVGGEDLVEVGGDGVVLHGAVAHDEVGGLGFGDSGDGLVAGVFVKTGNQEVVRYAEYLFAGDLALFDLA